MNKKKKIIKNQPRNQRSATRRVGGFLIAAFFVLCQGFSSELMAAPGTTAANFLKIGLGARGASMAEAQSAISEDVNTSYWNPAGLSTLRFQELALMHYELAEEVRFQNLGYAIPTRRRGTFSVGATLLDYGSIKGYDENSIPTASVDASQLLVSGSWAKTLFPTSKLSAGMSFKYLRSDLAGYTASAPMLDAGLLYPIETGRLRGLKLSGVIRNMGTDIKYNGQGSPLPRQMVLGGGFSALGGNLNLALDVIKPRDTSAYAAAGVEYRVFEMLRLRLGYNTQSDFVGNGVTYGLGLQFTQWNIDYALVPFGDLGNSNRVSIGWRFGRALEMKSAEEQVNASYEHARRQLAHGKGVEAYSTLNELLLIAPWHNPSVELKAKIEKQFSEMAVDKNKTKMETEIAEKFSEAKAAFDRDELVQAKKGFQSIVALNPEHTGAKVHLDRIENRYASLAHESFKLGMDFFAAGDYPKAKLAFQKTLTINEAHAEAASMLTKTDEVMVDASKREQEMSRLAGASQAYRDGLAAYQKNDFETALEKFAAVRSAVPDFEEVAHYESLSKTSYTNLLFEESQVDHQNGRLEQAVNKLTRAAILTPTDGRVSTGLEMARRDLDLKNAKESQELYRDGLQDFLSGNTEKAEKKWKRALELDSTNEDAANALRKVEEKKAYEKANGK